MPVAVQQVSVEISEELVPSELPSGVHAMLLSGCIFTCLHDKNNDFCCLFLADIFVFSSEFNYIPLAALRVQQEGEGPIYFCFVNT